ncbi:MAG: PDZ domain-containing protein [Planctomycetota bacterium]
MIRYRSTLCLLATLVALAPARAQDATTPPPGTLVIEHGGDRLEIRLLPGAACPQVSVNGEEPAGAWKAEDGTHSLDAGAFHVVSTLQPGTVAAPFYYARLTTTPQDLRFGQLLNRQVPWAEALPNAGGEPRPCIGVQVGSIPTALAEHLELDANRCVLILSTTADGPAATAGIRANDILLAIDGKDGVTDEALSKAVDAKKPGETMTLGILRKGNRRDIELEVGKEAVNVAPQWLRTLDTSWRFPTATALQPLLFYANADTTWLRAITGLQGGQGAPDQAKEPAPAADKSLQQQIDELRALCERIERRLEAKTETKDR